MPGRFRSSFARNIKPRRGTWELIESAHIDEVDMESVVGALGRDGVVVSAYETAHRATYHLPLRR
jgi:hypothetical protein